LIDGRSSSTNHLTVQSESAAEPSPERKTLTQKAFLRGGSGVLDFVGLKWGRIIKAHMNDIDPALTPDSSLSLDSAWAEVRHALRQSMGARSFDHWLKPVQLLDSDPATGVVRLGVSSSFMAGWVTNHHGERLVQAWRAVDPRVHAVDIVATTEQVTVRAPIATPEKAEAAPAKSETPNPFDPRLTFSSFITGPSNSVAANAAKALCKGDGGRFNPLFIHAQTGQGKTHILHAIGHAWRLANPDKTVLYMSAERFMLDFVSAVRAKDTFSFKARLRGAALLMIDDVQFIAGKETTQEEFLHTVDEILSHGGKLVISSDRGPHALDGVEGRILSRLTQGLVADIKPADFMLRRDIVASKAAAMAGVCVSEDVLDMLAGRIVSNIRELEGALNRLVAYAALGEKDITPAFAEDVLADMFRASQRRITIDEIQKRVAEHFRIRQAEMVSARRAREVARPRQIAMYLAKQLTPRSLPEIGRRFGGRDHTTVIHAVRQIERLRGIDTDIDNDVRALMRALEG
jgi:chromosomal replication initiator protein